MDDVKFTKGPWRAEFYASDVRVMNDRGTIAEVRGFGSGSDIQEANAHLISASLEMFEALKEAESFEAALIGEWADFWDVAPQLLIDQLMKVQGARNIALAKALGKATP